MKNDKEDAKVTIFDVIRYPVDDEGFFIGGCNMHDLPEEVRVKWIESEKVNNHLPINERLIIFKKILAEYEE